MDKTLDTTAYQWVQMDTNVLPENALAAGKDQSDTFNVFVGCAEIDGQPHVGKVHNGNRYLGYDNKEKRVTSEKFSVLCVNPDAEVEWVEYEEGEFPRRAVISGKLSSGATFYVGRGFTQNQLTPGMVSTHQDPYKLSALYDGKIHTMTKFEVLVVKGEEKEAKSQSALDEREEETMNEKEIGKKEEASLGDFIGAMAGLMAASAPPEEGAAMKQFGMAMGSVFEGFEKVTDDDSKETTKEVEAKVETSQSSMSEKEVGKGAEGVAINAKGSLMLSEIMEELETIEATIASEEDKHEKQIADLEEKHLAEMETMKQNLKIKRQELKDCLK